MKLPLLQHTPKDPTNNWNKVARDYDKRVGDNGDFLQKTYINPAILGMLGNVRNRNILDVACGTGYFAKILKDKGANVVGVDISEKMIKIAKEKYEETGIKFLVRDAKDLEGIASNQFEFVISNMSFHAIKDVSETIDEIARVIQTGGKLIFSIPHPWTQEAETVKERDQYYLRLKTYKTPSEVKDKTYGKKGIVLYHRPLEFYIKKLTDHRFEITNFAEISVEHLKGNLIGDHKLLQHKREFPSFLIIGATKNLVTY